MEQMAETAKEIQNCIQIENDAFPVLLYIYPNTLGETLALFLRSFCFLYAMWDSNFPNILSLSSRKFYFLFEVYVIFIFPFPLKFFRCLYGSTMDFSASFSWVTFLFLQRFPLSVRKLFSIHCSVGELILHRISLLFPLFPMKVSLFFNRYLDFEGYFFAIPMRFGFRCHVLHSLLIHFLEISICVCSCF